MSPCHAPFFYAPFTPPSRLEHFSLPFMLSLLSVTSYVWHIPTVDRESFEQRLNYTLGLPLKISPAVLFRK